MSSEADSEKDKELNDDSSPKKQLRRPFADTQEKLLNGTDFGSKGQSTLSVDAPEFVPKFIRQSGNLSATAAEFVPRQTVLPHYTHIENADTLHESFQQLQMGYVPPTEEILSRFKSTLKTLINQPGNMEELMRPIIDLLLQVSDDKIVHTVIEILFEQCVSEPNFRYTGARLCRQLCKELKSNKIFDNFRSVFLTRCKEEYLKKEDLIADPESINRLCGFTMFIGELFLNLEVENSSGGTQKIGILRAPVLKDLLLILLSHPTDFTVKCAMQLLKLTGSTIEETAYLNKPEEGSYDAVFLQIRQLDTYPNLNQTSKCLIKSVLNLKDNNWGQSRNSSTPTANDGTSQSYQQPATFTQNDPVFYNPQGQPITAEEAGYLDQQYNTYIQEEEEVYARWEAGEIEDGHWQEGGDYQQWSDPNDMGYNNGYYPDPGMVQYEENYMDDEMEAAYEEFLRQQGQHQ